jgi:sulfhydrogenase subunit delta
MKPTVAVHKLSSCDGCQLAFINAGEALLQLTELVDIKHFAEAGYIDHGAKVDIAFVEGSVSTPDEAQRIKDIRHESGFVITIGACATSGGLQALRNGKDIDDWMRTVYAHPEYIEVLDTATPIADHIKVDLELWGCPINTGQIVHVVRQLLFGVAPAIDAESLCLDCKRQGHVCTLVAKEEPCMGPVTHTGCGALCPSVGRACYACYGPADTTNTQALTCRFEGFGLLPREIIQRFNFITNKAPVFQKAAQAISSSVDDYTHDSS